MVFISYSRVDEVKQQWQVQGFASEYAVRVAATDQAMGGGQGDIVVDDPLLLIAQVDVTGGVEVSDDPGSKEPLPEDD